MPLISFEVEFSISWIENCVTVANAGTAVTIKITDANFMFLLLLYQQKTMQN